MNEVLKAFQGTDNNIRAQAETFYNQQLQGNPAAVLQELFAILTNNRPSSGVAGTAAAAAAAATDDSIRGLSAVLLRRIVEDKCAQLSPDLIIQLRTSLVQVGW